MGFNPVKAFTNAVKSVAKVITSPTRSVLALGTLGLSEATGWGKKFSNTGVGKTLDMAGYVAAAVAGGAAAVGAMGGAAAGGVGGTAAAVGSGTATAATGGTAAAAGGSSLLTAGNIIGAASAVQGAASYLSAKDQAKEQARAQQRAQDQAAQAQRESEIMRKQALLTAQMSVGQRINHAAAVVNRLKNTNTSSMGGDEEKLGG